MTYFGVLATFILPPLMALLILVPRDVWRRFRDRRAPVDWKPYKIILIHVALALVYTTPWDNYLVATQVWWYDPDLVTGLTLGYVPIEEYTFFIVQTLMTGLWALFVMRHIVTEIGAVRESVSMRIRSSLLIGIPWLLSTILLLAGWKPGAYLTLILSWALVPVIVQTAFGADILFANIRRVLWTVIPTTLYLWIVDYLAIQSGTWVIDPAQTTGIKLGVLPVEEMIFFFMTNLIISLGMTLMLSPDSYSRFQSWIALYRSKYSNQNQSTT
jgi:putative membrane protein